MRINVTGECPTAKALRGYLAKHDFHLTVHNPNWIIHIEEPEEATKPALDSRGGELEQAILRHLRKQLTTPVEICPGRTVSSDREIRIRVPQSEPERRAVEIGVFRGLLELAKQEIQTRWWDPIIQRKSK